MDNKFSKIMLNKLIMCNKIKMYSLNKLIMDNN